MATRTATRRTTRATTRRAVTKRTRRTPRGTRAKRATTATRPTDKSDGDGSDGDGNDGEKGSNPLEKLGQGFEAVGEVIKWIVWIVLAVVVHRRRRVPPAQVPGQLHRLGEGAARLVPRAVRQEGGEGEDRRGRGRGGRRAATPAAVLGVRQPVHRRHGQDPHRPRTRRLHVLRVRRLGVGPRRWAASRTKRRASSPSASPKTTPTWKQPGKVLAELYVMAMYSKKDLPPDAKKKLAAFWDSLESEPAVR